MKGNKLVKTAIAQCVIVSAMGALATTSTSVLAAAKMEKCYGVAKAGTNDCQTSTASCAGSAKHDGQGDAFIFLPKGVCEKLVHGSLTPTSGDKKHRKQ